MMVRVLFVLLLLARSSAGGRQFPVCRDFSVWALTWGSLGRAYLEKAKSDCEDDQKKVDVDAWYRLTPHQLKRLPDYIQKSFLRLRFDQETQDFLDASRAQSDSVSLQFWYIVAQWVLSFRLSKTSVNGLLGRGSMFIFSHSQLAEFLQLPPDWDPTDKTVLDLGSGDGAVTEVMKHFYNNVLVTEASGPMQWRLARRGFTVLPLDSWASYSRPLHLISALNLLDRHPEPLVFLEELRRLSLANNRAPILLAAVFPWYQWSEFSEDPLPKDRIVLQDAPFQNQAWEFLHHHILPRGFGLIRWTRLPYLCEGNAYKSYYYLHDALFLLQPL